MEPALPAAPLNGRRQLGSGGRRFAALLLLAALTALAGCGRSGRARLDGAWRVGLGACAMSLDAGGGRLAVTCLRSNDLWILDAAKGTLLHRIDTLPRPRTALFHPEHEAVFVAEGLSSVALIRLDDERVARRFRPVSRISRLAWEPDSGRLFGAHEGLPTLGVYRLRDMHHETTVAVGGAVTDLAFLGREGWLATRQADALVKVSLTDLSVKNAALAGPDPRALDLLPAADRGFLACHGRAGEAAPLALPTPIPSPDSLGALSPSAGAEDADAGPAAEAAAEEPESPPARAAWDGGGLAVFRLSDVRRIDYIEVGGGPVAVVVGPSARRALVACEDGILKTVDLKRRKVLYGLPLGGRPTCMLRDPDGRHILVALADRKSVLRVRTGEGW